MTIDRMEIDDAGANPKRLAEAITKQLGDTPHAIDVRQIAADIDIYEIREEPLNGLAGCLIVPEDKSVGAIAVDGKMGEERKRYTIGHEIGHYVNPMHRASSPEGFKCTRKDMLTDRTAPGDKHAKMEAEANQFAAELLMPDPWVRRFLRSKIGLDLQHIFDMARLFEVSKESAARRYLSFVSEPAAVVFSREGRVRYVKKCDDFPRMSVWNRQPMPKDCYSMTSEKDRGLVLQVRLSGHFLHYTHFVKSSRPPALDPHLAISRFLPRPVSRGEKVPFDNVPEIVRLHSFGPLGPDRIE